MPPGSTTVAVFAEVRLVVTYPAFVPVTMTDNVALMSAVVSVYVDAVAPLIAVPLRSHCHARVTGAGVQVPAAPVRTWPT